MAAAPGRRSRGGGACSTRGPPWRARAPRACSCSAGSPPLAERSRAPGACSTSPAPPPPRPPARTNRD
eukprot:9389349-Heterocapsa_arctica.AAC.1